MKKILAGILIVIALVVAAVVLFYKPCKQPGQSMIKLYQFGCAVRLDAAELSVEFCRSLNRDDYCETTEEDKPAINRFLNDKVNKCAAELLEKEGYCTDKIEDLVKWI